MAIVRTVSGPTLADDFNRANSDTPGGNWVEVTSDWDIISNTLRTGPNTQGSLVKNTTATMDGGFIQALASGSLATGHNPGMFLRLHSTSNGYEFRLFNNGSLLDIRRWSGGVATVLGLTNPAYVISGAGAMQFYVADSLQWGRFYAGDAWISITRTDATFNGNSGVAALRSASGTGSSVTKIRDNFLWMPNPFFRMTLTDPGAWAGWKAKVYNSSGTLICQATESGDIALPDARDSTHLVPLAGWARIDITDSSDVVLDTFAGPIWPGEEFEWDGSPIAVGVTGELSVDYGDDWATLALTEPILEVGDFVTQVQWLITLDTDPTFATPTVDETTAGAGLFFDTGTGALTDNTDYLAKAIVTTNDVGVLDDSNVVEFTTTDGPTKGTTPTVTLVSPKSDTHIEVQISAFMHPDGQVNQEDFDPDAPESYATTIELQARLASDPNWNTPLETVQFPYSSEAALRRYAFHGLTQNLSHKFRGRLLDGYLAAWTLYSSDLTESTEATPAQNPLQPTLTIDECGRNLEWSGSAFAHSATGTHTASEIQVIVGSTSKRIVYLGAITSGTIPDLGPNDYDLKLRYRDDLNRWGPQSTIEECTVEEYPPVPVFTDPAPGTVVSAGFTLEWEIYDPNSIGYLSDVELSTNGTSFTVVANGQAGFTTAFSTTGRNNGDYIYRVRSQHPSTGEHGEYAYFRFTLDRTGARAISYHFANYDSDEALTADGWRQIHSGPEHVNWGLRDDEDPFEETTNRVGLMAQRLHGGTSTRRSGFVNDNIGEPDEFDLTVVFEHIPGECAWPPYRFANANLTRGGGLIFGVEGAAGAERSGRYTMLDWGIQPWPWGPLMACASDAYQAGAQLESTKYAAANPTVAVTYGRTNRTSTLRTALYRRLTPTLVQAATTLPSSTSPRIGGAYVYTEEFIVLGLRRKLYTIFQQVRRGVSGGVPGWFIKTQLLGPGIAYAQWHREEFVSQINTGGFELPCGACGLGFQDMDSLGVGRSEGILFTDFSINVLSYGSCVAPAEVGCEADWDFTTFHSDDITPHYGSADGEGNVLEASYYDRRTCPRPYLKEPRDFSETEIDYPAGASRIGQITVSVVDKRLFGEDQDSGIVSAFAYDYIGRRAVLRRWREDLGMVTVFDGVIDSYEIDSRSIVTYHFHLRDPRERERDVELVTRNETFALYPEPGPVEDYGEIPGGFLLPAADIDQVGVNFVLVDTASGPNNIAYGWVDLTQMSSDDLANWLVPFMNPVLDPLTGDLAFKDVTVRWRPEGGDDDDWTYLRDMPLYSFDDLTDQFISVELKHLYMGSYDVADLPADDDPIEFQVLAAKTTERTPYVWDGGTFGDLAIAAYSGEFTEYPPNIRYNADEFDTWAEDTTNARFMEYQPRKNLREWMERNVYGAIAHAPSFDADMRIVPSPWELPDASQELIEIDAEWVIPVGEWSESVSSVINRVKYTYTKESVLSRELVQGQALAGGGLRTVPRPQFHEPSFRWERFVEEKITLDAVDTVSAAEFGAQVIEYEPVTVRAFGVVEGVPLNLLFGGGVASTIPEHVVNMVLTRYSRGAAEYVALVRSGMAHGPTFDPFTLDVINGQWVKLNLGWLPEYSTGERGAFRYMQVKAITDPDIARRRFRLEDGGPVIILEGESEGVEDLLDPPTIGTLTETADFRIEVPITFPASAPANYRVRVEYAVNATEPAPNSGLWTLVGYLEAEGDILTGSFPAGTKVWIRARGEAFNTRPSAWTDAETITLASTPALTFISLTLTENESAGCTPTLTWAPNAYAEGLRIETSVGAEGHTPSYSTWDDVDSDTPLTVALTDQDLDFEEEIVVRVTAYPTFSGGAVSGTPGSVYVLRKLCEADTSTMGVSDFLGLNDTPDSYSGQAGKLVSVNGTETALEFVSPAGMPSGTSFPGSPSSGDLFYRTDRNILYYYDGTRWLSLQIFVSQPFHFVTINATVTATAGRASAIWDGIYDIYILKATFNYQLSGSGNWTVTLTKTTTGGSSTTLASSGAFTTTALTQTTVDVGTVVPSTDGLFQFAVVGTENSGTATLVHCFAAFTYRLVG